MSYTPKEMAVFLRRCANCVCDRSCPWWDVTHCEASLMKAAADLLEEVDGHEADA